MLESQDKDMELIPQAWNLPEILPREQHPWSNHSKGRLAKAAV